MTRTDRRRWILLATVSTGLLLITIDNSILYTALPEITRVLGATPGESLWIINAYPLVMAGLLLGAGTLGDRVGHKRMFVIGLIVFGAASLLAAFSPTALLLIVARGLLAVGAAAMMPATLALIRVTFENQRERNIAIGVWGSVSVVGAAIGPIVGGLLLEFFWWGSVFLVNVPVVLAAIVATLILAPGGDRDTSRPWDLLSSVLAMIGLVGVVVALKEVTKAEPAWALAIGAVVVGGVGLGLFARRQRRLPYPLLDFAISRNPALAAGVVAAGLAMFTFAGVELSTTQRFQLVEGFTPLQAGFLVAAIALGSLPGSLLSGAVLHRTGPRPLISGGLLVAAAGILSAVLLLPLGWGWLVAGLLVAGFGLGFVMSAASSAIMGSAPAHRAGMAASVEEVSYELGGLTAVAVLGNLILSIDTGYPAVLGIVAAVLLVAALSTGWLLRPRRS